jgi:hypothetical protein
VRPPDRPAGGTGGQSGRKGGLVDRMKDRFT